MPYQAVRDQIDAALLQCRNVRRQTANVSSRLETAMYQVHALGAVLRQRIRQCRDAECKM